MTAEPNVFDVITGALIAQAQAYALLVRLLEANNALPPGVTRDALDRLIENLEGKAPPHQLAHLNEISRQLGLLPPRREAPLP